MSIYKLEEYDEVLKRIREKVKKKGVKLNPAINEESIIAFEKLHNILLPESYRRFLLQIGDGGIMFDNRELNILVETVSDKILEFPFPLTECWVWEDREEDSDEINEKIRDCIENGSIELTDIGCGQTYNLIITGQCRGEIWSISDVGACELIPRRDFLSWYEYWIDGGEDYFSD